MNNTWLLLHEHIQNDVSADCIWSCSLEGNFLVLCYDYKTMLQFFTRVCETMYVSKELQRHAPYMSSEGC